MSDSFRPHGVKHTRLPCPSSTPGTYSNSGPLSWWCHQTVSSSVNLFSSHLQSFPVSGSFPRTRFFVSGGQSTGVSASASLLPMNIQDWFPLELAGWISLQSKRTFKSQLTYNFYIWNTLMSGIRESLSTRSTWGISSGWNEFKELGTLSLLLSQVLVLALQLQPWLVFHSYKSEMCLCLIMARNAKQVNKQKKQKGDNFK